MGLGQADQDGEVAVAALLIEVAGRLAADGCGHHGVDVAGLQAVAGGAHAVDVDAHGGLAQRAQHLQVGDAGYALHGGADLVGGGLQHLQVGAEQLDRVFALHARGGFLDVVLDVLGEVELHAREMALHVVGELLGQLLLGDVAGPGVERLQRHEEFGVEEAGGVGAVVGSTVLGHHGLDLGVALDQRPHAVDVAVAFLERDRARHGGADPEVAFLQVGQELGAERTGGHDGQDDQHAGAAERQDAVGQGELGRRHVEPAQLAHDEGVGLFQVVGQQHGRQGRRHREGGQQAAGDGVGIGARHRPEDVALDPGHGEQRHEAGDDDRGGEED